MRMDTVMEEGEDSPWDYEMDITQLCRICANPNEYLIPIFQGEGVEHDLKNKISKHLPIKVSESDKLPTQLCYQCASTLIAWHDMVVGCLEADEKLKALTQDEENETNIIEESIQQTASITGTVKIEPRSFQVSKTVETSNNVAQHLTLSDTVELEKVAGEEEVTTLVPEFIEEVSSEPRSLSFRNYQIATWALRKKLLRVNTSRSVVKTLPNNGKNKANCNESCSSNNIDGLSEGKGSNSLDEVELNIGDPKPKHKCSSCSRSFIRAYDLKRHSLVHLHMEAFENNETGEPDCQDVNPEGSQRSSSISSKTIVIFTCELCFRIFKAKNSYERHKRIHTGERPFQCSECSKRFRDSGGLARHVKEVHAKIRNHPCNICNKWFLNRATLEDHYRTHTGERPYICHQCGITSKSKAALYQHNKIHSNFLPHVCVYCGKCFRRRQELIAHTTIHTNEKTHICDKCGKGFSTRSELQRHILVHSDDKPFSCLICGISFRRKRYLKNHLKSRHGRTEDLQSSELMPVESLGFT